MQWGLVTGDLERLGRQRSLGLARVVRRFNDLAVPGMGGLWFGKPMLLSMVGLWLNERLQEMPGTASHRRLRRQSSTRLAEAVEAWACLRTLQQLEVGQRDPRLRGRLKLRTFERDATPFRSLLRPGAYVSQPMRMAVIQPLRALGFVEAGSERFSSYSLTERGHDFIAAALHGRRKDSLEKWLENWSSVEEGKPAVALKVLSPLTPLSPEAAGLLRESIIDGGFPGAERRKHAWAWVEALRTEALQPAVNWEDRPAMLEPQHWQILRTGAAFFLVRDAALGVLDCLEDHLGRHDPASLSLAKGSGLPSPVQQAVETVRELAATAKVQLEEMRRVAPSLTTDDTQALELAATFYEECLASDPVACSRALVKRDGRTVVLDDQQYVRPGPSFRVKPRAGASVVDDDGADDQDVGDSLASASATNTSWFSHLPGVSPRLLNLYMLNCDLCDPPELESALETLGTQYVQLVKDSA